MAWIRDKGYVVQANLKAAGWAGTFSPGTNVPVSGIYRCTVCKKEVTCNEGDPLPPQNKSQHDHTQAVNWQLIVKTNTQGID